MSAETVVRKHEKELLHQQVLDLHHPNKSLSQICAEAKKVFKKEVAKSAVQSIIRNFKDRPSIAARKFPGRSRKIMDQDVPTYLHTVSFLTCMTCSLGTKQGCSGWPGSNQVGRQRNLLMCCMKRP